MMHDEKFNAWYGIVAIGVAIALYVGVKRPGLEPIQISHPGIKVLDPRMVVEHPETRDLEERAYLLGCLDGLYEGAGVITEADQDKVFSYQKRWCEAKSHTLHEPAPQGE